ncbi:MAG: hypothetical protein LQ343_004133 [Gyalolechia ehrenbergii]|nr:MAG: hypothetical protein LQ343_004133 [Gyalolechia ehrenbergii]
MGTSDVITDLLLVGFPIPIILKSHMAAKRKVSLVLLFSLSLILIGITIYRVIEVVHRHSDQQFRSLIASLEILAAAAVSNALVLGSFVRDRGIKKQRYRFDSVGGNSSLDRAGTGARPRTLTIQTWGSDADLAGELGMRMAPDLEKQQSQSSKPRPAPIALPPASYANTSTPKILHSNWNFSDESDRRNEKSDLESEGNTELLPPSPGEVEIVTPRRTSFFDVGGLLGDDTISPARRRGPEPSIPEITPAPLPLDTTHAVSPTILLASEPARKGSNALMSDIGGLLSVQKRESPVVRNFSRPTCPEIHSPQFMPTIRRASHPDTQNHGPSSLHPRQGQESSSSSTLRDVGGLLD